jgi:hypothetical protein
VNKWVQGDLVRYQGGTSRRIRLGV